MKILQILFSTLLSTALLLSIQTIYAQPVYKHRLKNGLQIFVKVDKRAPVVISQIWYKVGSSNEHPGITGISHALEHMMFQGTKKYPHGELAKIIAAHGGIQNAGTNQDYTVYYQELPAKNLAISFKLEADRMKNLIITKKRFATEIEVVKEEKRLRIDNNPQALTFIRFSSLAKINTPYQHPVIGLDHDLANLNAAKLRKWYGHYYSPNNALLVVVGDVNPHEVYRLANKYFGKIKAQKNFIANSFPQKTPHGERKITLNLPAKLPLLLLGYNVPVIRSATKSWQPYALLLAAAILDLGPSSRLTKELIRQNQAASIVNASYNPFSKFSNVFTIAAIPTRNHSVAELKAALMKQITRLKTTPISNAELTRVKTQLTANKTFSRDSLSAQATEIGQLEVVGLSWQLGENLLTEIAEITPKQIQEVCKEFFTKNRLTIAILNPKR